MTLSFENWEFDLDLHEVVRRNEITEIKRFLSLGYNVNERNSDGRTPLHEAVCENIGNSHQEAINLLLNSGADVNAQDKTGYTALHYMAANNSSFSRTIFDLFFKFNARIEVCNDQGETAFFISVESGNLDMAQYLMGRGANVNQRRNDRSTPLHWACFNCDEKMIKFLIDNRADVRAKSIVCLTPLHEASRSNKKNSLQKAINLLLNNGACVNVRDSYGNTALHYMAMDKTGFSKKILDLLMKFNARIDVCNKQRETPLFLAVKSGNFEMAQLLIGRGADVNRRNKDGCTALHWACSYRDKKMIECLMENGADVNARNPNGHIPVRFYFCTNNGDERKDEKMNRLLLDFSDLTNNVLYSYTEFDLLLPQFLRKMILEQIAKLQVLKIPVHSTFLEVVSKSKPPNTEYLNKCTKELLMAKGSKLKNSWVTFFNLLVDDERKLKNYAGNQDLVEDFKKTDCNIKFPIYGVAIQKNMNKAIETRKVFDESAEKLSDCCPVFNPNHLIIRNVLDCLNSKDYKIFV